MIVGMLKNTSTGRLHPILFRPAPLPGGADLDMRAQRYKSKGHHTEGFDNRDAAMSGAQALCDSTHAEFRDVEWEWNGEGIPAIVTFFEHTVGARG